MAVLALCAGGTTLAVKPDGTLYVKARNTRLMANASATADAIAILQPGKAVTWKGADPKNKQWHRVEVDGKKGVVFQSNLAAQPPNLELITKNGEQKVDPVAYASSGAAVKGLSQGAIDYGNGKGTNYAEATKQIQKLEELAGKVGPAEMDAHARKAGLFRVVGPKETASRGRK
ncbi:SH3 domain-containing protein [Hyalangium rubrum]|uniref:SH3 domain-containing protein n=1 Tax=Hyalangium rubrum TaxID=3103134 RepID=A0ABU5GYZ3_9BACT|nr:SH3 domain-containing protein [Hyalangium sp. s54d21]MDY7225914.1 SH3 domain-containing protein [Hyalangium sp. s54d21]